MNELANNVDNDFNRLLHETRVMIEYLSNIAIEIEASMSYGEDTLEDICQHQDNIANYLVQLNDIIQDYNLDISKLNDDICILLEKSGYIPLDNFCAPRLWL